MQLSIKRSLIYQVLFVLCIGIPYLNNFELTISVWMLVFFLTIQTKYSLSFTKQFVSLALILIIAIVTSFFNDHKFYFIARDFAYLIKPVVGLAIGYQMLKHLKTKVFHTIIYTGLIIAICHIAILIVAFSVHHARTLNDLRFYGGYFSDFEVYVLIILLFYKQLNIHMSSRKVRIFAWIIGFSALMYFARTNIIQFMILWVAMKGYFRVTPRAITVVTSVILLTMIGYGTILYINPKRNGPGIEAFLYKIKVAPIEPFKTKINRNDWQDFNDNYRSYENIITIQQVGAQGIAAVLFGQGLGSQVDLKQKIWLGDMELRHISILHNGYLTIFLKSGIAGVLLLLFTIYLLFIKLPPTTGKIRHLNHLLLGSGIFMIASYWVFMGYYLIADTKAILFGLLIAYRELLLNQHNQLPAK